jgi:hypothetical protein
VVNGLIFMDWTWSHMLAASCRSWKDCCCKLDREMGWHCKTWKEQQDHHSLEYSNAKCTENWAVREQETWAWFHVWNCTTPSCSLWTACLVHMLVNTCLLQHACRPSLTERNTLDVNNPSNPKRSWPI